MFKMLNKQWDEPISQVENFSPLEEVAQGIGDYEIIGIITKNFSRQILKYGVYLDTQELVTAGSKEAKYEQGIADCD